MRRMSKVVTEALEMSMDGKFNHKIARGLACDELPKLPDDLGEILRSAFPDGALGLKYLRYERVSPEEAALETARSCSSAGYDISANNMHMVKFLFAYGDNLQYTIEKYVWFIFADKGGTTLMGGSKFVCRPVWTDKLISPGDSNIFLRFLRDKIGAKKVDGNYTCLINGQRSQDLSVPYLRIFSKTPKDRFTRGESTVVHYLLGKYGLTNTITNITGNKLFKVMSLADSYSVDTNAYVVYTSNGIKPRSYIQNDYKQPDVAIVIPIKSKTPLFDRAMVSVFYTLDHFPDVPFSLLDSYKNWQMLLGKILFGNKWPVWLTQNMLKHYNTLETQYMTPIMHQFIKNDFDDLLDIDLREDGFFKILLVTFINFDTWMQLSSEISASCWDKRLTINYFILYKMICQINRLGWDLMELSSSGRLTPKAIKDRLAKQVTLRKIYSIRKDNYSAQPVMYHGDNYVYKLSVAAGIQLNSPGSTGAKSNKGSSPVDDTTLLNESQLVAGTMMSVSSSKLSPISTLNVYAPLDEVSMTIIPDEVTMTHLSSIREVLRKLPRLSSNSVLPKLFNRFVTYPTKPPANW